MRGADHPLVGDSAPGAWRPLRWIGRNRYLLSGKQDSLDQIQWDLILLRPHRSPCLPAQFSKCSYVLGLWLCSQWAYYWRAVEGHHVIHES